MTPEDLARLEAVRARIRAKLDARHRPSGQPPDPPPRYDEVFFEGAAFIEALARGEGPDGVDEWPDAPPWPFAAPEHPELPAALSPPAPPAPAHPASPAASPHQPPPVDSASLPRPDVPRASRSRRRA